MHLKPQMHSKTACTSMVNHLGESTCRTLANPDLPATLEQPLLPTLVAAAALLTLVITSDLRLQREPPTMCHKILADKVIQLSSKLDFKKVHLNAGKKLSNKCTQLWMRDTAQQLFVKPATEMEAFHQSTNPPNTISLLIHCPENGKLGPFSLSVPFQGQFHAYGAVRLLPRYVFNSPGQEECNPGGLLGAARRHLSSPL